MLDAVQAALDSEGKEDPATSNPDKALAQAPKPAAEKVEGDKTEADLSDEDLKRLSQGVQKRIRSLVGERKKLETEIVGLKPKAEQLDHITSQIRQTGLDQSDLAVTFDIATALKRGDLFGARKLLAPIYEQVMRATGGVLPDDLRQEVQGGLMPVQRAQELAVARAAAQQAAFQGQQAQQRQAADSAQQLTNSVVNSVNDWEKAKAASDPDWALKKPEIMDALQLALLKGNRPKNEADALQMAEKALTEVNDRLRRYRPAPRAVRAVVSGGGASPRNTAQPKSMLDVVSSVLG